MNVFQITFQMKLVVKQFYNLLIKENSYIISSLNSNKALGLILFLLKNGISKQLADLFNLPFINGVFPLVLKTAKVVPAFFIKSFKIRLY